VLLLGAGGAARGVILPLLQEGPQQIVIANRTRATADALGAHFAPYLSHPGQVRACDFADLDQAFDIVINATSASLSSSLPPVPASAFSRDTLALDMMYGNEPTVFMEFAAAQGAATRDGLGMLVEQAAEAFAIWRGVRPDTATVLTAMRSQA
jgi:shikimate dehydrogenase